MNIKIEATDKSFSSLGGLVIFKKAVDVSPLAGLITPNLPLLVSGPSRSLQKFHQLLFGFKAGAECLEDMDELAKDLGFATICNGEPYTAKAHGDFLRSFSNLQCKNLNHALLDLAYGMRASLFPDRKEITVDFDSTSNQQYGKKMEGVALNYKGIPMQVFDEYGIQYWNDVRAGNTYSSNGVGEIVHTIFSRMPAVKAFKDLRRYARGDSAFCKLEFFNACLTKSVGFVVALRALMLAPILGQITHWQNQNPGKDKRIKFYDGRECEMGATIYRPKKCGAILRVVVIRAVKKGREKAYALIGAFAYNFMRFVSLKSFDWESEFYSVDKNLTALQDLLLS